MSASERGDIEQRKKSQLTKDTKHDKATQKEKVHHWCTCQLGTTCKTHQNQRTPQNETVGRVGDGGESWGQLRVPLYMEELYVRHSPAAPIDMSSRSFSDAYNNLPAQCGGSGHPSGPSWLWPVYIGTYVEGDVFRNTSTFLQGHHAEQSLASEQHMQRNFRDERSNTKSRRSRGDIDAIQVGVLEGMMRYFKVYGG